MVSLLIIILGIILVTTLLSVDMDKHRDSFAQLSYENQNSTGQNKWSTYFEGNKDYQLCSNESNVCFDAVHIAYESPTTITVLSQNTQALSKAVDEIKKDGYKIEGVLPSVLADDPTRIIMGK